MKIAFVDQPIGFIRPGRISGSINTIVYETARQVARRAEVVVYSRRSPEQTSEEALEGVRYKRFESVWDERINGRIGPLFRFRSAASPWFLSPLYYRSYIHAIADDLIREKCDVVHVYNFAQFASYIHSRESSAKVVLNMQCEWLIQLSRNTIERHLGSVDRVIGCSDFITDGAKRRFPFLANRCATVPNGADPAKFATMCSTKTEVRSKTILYTGRISPEKGVHVLIDAFALVAQSEPDAQLHLIGPEWVAPPSFLCGLADDPEVRDLVPLCDRYLGRLKQRVPEGLRERVRFLGPMDQSEMREHYAQAWAAVHPSICNEAFGMPIAEAMMSSLPVIVSAAGGMPEIVVDGKTGYVVKKNDAQALADALLKLLRDPQSRNQMGVAAKERALELYTWERVADLTVREDRDLLFGSVPSTPVAAKVAS
jgi:glycosyltransferase involved in cell wall biosynthesis